MTPFVLFFQEQNQLKTPMTKNCVQNIAPSMHILPAHPKQNLVVESQKNNPFVCVSTLWLNFEVDVL
jgi:hypothetical protein